MIEDQKHFKIKLDCQVGDLAALFEHRSALLVAAQLHHSYKESKDDLIGTGPELYAEQWICNYIATPDARFKDLVLIYFTKILQGAQKNE